MSINYNTFGAVCCVYDDDVWLPFALESIYRECDAIFILFGDRPWNGRRSDNKSTLERIQNFPDPQGKIRLIFGSWRNETDQRNHGLMLLQRERFDYCFIVDADEIYDPLQLRRMMLVAVENPQVACWHMTVYVYWKSLYFRIEPPEEYKPPVFVKVGAGKFSQNRLVEAGSRALIPMEIGFCHHMSYARSSEAILKKITTFSHVDEMQPGWYENVWLAWDRNTKMENIHPTHPAAYKRAVPVNPETLPPVLKKLYRRPVAESIDSNASRK